MFSKGAYIKPLPLSYLRFAYRHQIIKAGIATAATALYALVIKIDVELHERIAIYGHDCT